MEHSHCKSEYDVRSIRDNLVMVLWVFIWMASLTVADKAALYGWWEDGWLTLLAVAVNVALGLGMMVAFMRLMRGMDELQRKIQLDALSMALGTWGYIVDEEVTDIFMLMCVSYSAAVLIGVWRYR